MTTAETERADLAVVGAGAAGLFAAIHAAGAAPDLKVIALDGARSLGAKILVAGGGRCNVTHHAVTEDRYFGSSRNAVKKVLRRYTVEDTVAFFENLGVTLKREDTGKLFPTTDSARAVLDALLRAAREAGAEIRHPWRVETIGAAPDGFIITSDMGHQLRAARVVLAAGGKSLPKSGSDGAGERLARSLGLPITARVLPALVPLTLPRDHFLCALSGLAFDATLRVRAATGKVLHAEPGPVLCTHFGLSGPAPMNISRVLLDARESERGVALTAAALEDAPEDLDRALAGLGKQTPLAELKSRGLPERLVLALCEHAGVDPRAPAADLRREPRRALVRALTDLPLPAEGPRGWNYAEVTAGGVPLAALHLRTMESRDRPGLHLAGEVCDVDGRIGGYNFQWAWSSGYVAGRAAAESLTAACL